MSRVIGYDDPTCDVKIADAEALAKKHDLQGVLIVAVRRDGMVESITYGDHPAQKIAMGDYADTVMQHTITKVPFQTMFGWGNDGVPKALMPVEKLILMDEKGWTAEAIERATHPEAE